CSLTRTLSFTIQEDDLIQNVIAISMWRRGNNLVIARSRMAKRLIRDAGHHFANVALPHWPLPHSTASGKIYLGSSGGHISCNHLEIVRLDSATRTELRRCEGQVFRRSRVPSSR